MGKGPVLPGGAKGYSPNLKFKTPAQREAERQALAYAGNAQAYANSGPSLSDERKLMTQAARDEANSQRYAALEDQRRYDSSNNDGNTEFYKNAAKAGNPAAPIAPIAPRYSSGPDSGFGGGSGASATPQPTLEDRLAAIAGMTGTIDPNLRKLVPTTGELDVMYGRLTDSINQSKDALNKDYTDAINAVKGNYAQSNQLLNSAIGTDNAALAKAAESFGIAPGEWNAGTTAQSQNELLNRLLGSNSSNQATDLAWFEKMQGLDTNQFTSLLNLANFDRQNAINSSNDKMLELQMMADEVARNQAMLALQEELGALGGGGSGGGGGRGGRRGGGGYSGKAADVYRTLTQSATQSGDLDFAGLTNQVQQLPPDMQRIFWDYWVQGGASGEGAAKAIQNDVLRGNTTFGGNSAVLEELYNLALGYTPGYAPIYSQSTQDKTSQATKQYGVPPITQLPQVTSSTPRRKTTPANALKTAVGAKKPPKTAATQKQKTLDKISKFF